MGEGISVTVMLGEKKRGLKNVVGEDDDKK